MFSIIKGYRMRWCVDSISVRYMQGIGNKGVMYGIGTELIVIYKRVL